MERVVVVGIGGCSHSGKSTLASRLHQKLLCPLVVHKLDWYFETYINLPYSKLRGWEQKKCWELPESVKYNLFKKDMLENIKKAKKFAKEKNDGKKYYLIVEGFLLFVWEDISKLCDIKIWIDGKLDVCMKRRVNRQRVSPYWYEFEVWKNYLKYKDVQLKNAGENILVLDCELEKTVMVEKSLSFVKKSVKKCTK